MKTIRFEQHESIGHIVLANPPSNLIATNFSDCLRDAVHEASETAIRALLIRAEGPNAYRSIEALQIPTIAAVRGAAFGGAFELALACDFIVAAENATFRCIEASVGSAPVAGAVQRLAERAGRAMAARYAMLSESMSGAQAGQLGVAAFVVPENDVENFALDLARRLGTGPTRSYAAIRALLKAWSAGGVPGADSLLLDITMGLHTTEDARMGRTARAEAFKRGAEPAPVTFIGR
ncbi:enoyl-CoA hydratase/isomerase [Cupriavidus basilensis OR16]|uniref:Enoyl-CoA hydratase/isomerase n=1 Tax=Cupriavidus basilensis OR16 TaxID=1127483 RepID=H1SEU9_9BURK|nr:enoyl-CoA hydratase/isomerase family protein [Cupriavidus basilensis]EHP39025.1 enoyl-CoA hydratase/isomerase [Cupriavidus basilensis OR16]